jgi:hypothetical protein
MPEVQQWFVDAMVAGKAEPSTGEVSQAVERPTEILLLRRERDDIRRRLAVKPRILEARRKIRDYWEPRVAQLKPLLEPQLAKLKALKELTAGHAQATYEGKGQQRYEHCADCRDRSTVEDNVRGLQEAYDFALHNLNAQKQENERLTAEFESVTASEHKRLKEIEKILEAAGRKREPEPIVRVPRMEPINPPEAKRSLGPSEVLINIDR